MIKGSSTHLGREKVFKEATRVLLDEDIPKPNADCGFCVWAKGVSEE